MPIYVSTTFSEHGSQVSGVVESMLAHGIDKIELGSIHGVERGLQERLARHGAEYITHNYFPPQDQDVIVNIASDDDEIRSISLDFAKKALDFAIAIGAKIYTIHPGFLIHPQGESAPGSSFYDFQFSSTGTQNAQERSPYFRRFLESLAELRAYVHGKPIRLAVETQGSFEKPGVVLFSRPEEFRDFCANFGSDEQVGINLNLAHLYLSSRYYGFDIEEALKILQPKVFAIEVSHSDGIHDNHALPQDSDWYFPYFNKFDFAGKPVIIEVRDCDITNILSAIALFKAKVNYLR